MSQAEARQLLTRRITKQALRDDEEAVNNLLELLAYLPLAIVQAAAFINNNDISVSAYITLFRKKVLRLSSSASISRTLADIERWKARWQERGISPSIRYKSKTYLLRYLSFMACIDRSNIPQSLLPPRGSPLQQINAIWTLKGYAFITERQQALPELEGEKFFDMHRPVHMASVWWLDGHDKQMIWISKAAARLKKLIPYGRHEEKKVWMMYLSHAIHVAGLDGTLAGIVRASRLD
jgi:hypothetical protein